MPGGKFSLPKSAQNQALAAAAASGGIPAPGAVPAPNDLLAMLQGGMDPQMLMALLAMLAGMGPGGVPGQAGAVPGGAGAAPASPIEAAYGA